MKRITSAVLALLVLALITSVAFGQASVPNLINFQGRLADTSGVPVADGPHNLTFAIYSLLSGGSTLWSEAASVTTKDGVFTHPLGSATPFSQTLFQTYDSLFLQITVEAEVISPRTLLTSVPYTRLANHLESRDFSNDTVTIKTFDNQISTYGSDGKEQIRLWGQSYGEILLYDASAANDLTVTLTATNNSGGQLYLDQEDGTAGTVLRGGTTFDGGSLTMRDNAGVLSISLDAGLTGNSAAFLPSGAISDLEILDEPGIAHEYNSGTIVLTSTTTAYDTVTISVPTSGYVVVTAHAYLTRDHVNGTDNLLRMFISKTAGALEFDNSALWRNNSNSPTNTGSDEILPASCTKVEAVAPGTHTYYLNASAFTGSGELWRRHLTAMFFPTAYGTVVSTVASKSGDERSISSVDGVHPLTESELTTITVEEHNARLQEELAAMRAEMEARLQKLEQQVSQTAGSQQQER